MMNEQIKMHDLILMVCKSVDRVRRMGLYVRGGTGSCKICLRRLPKNINIVGVRIHLERESILSNITFFECNDRNR